MSNTMNDKMNEKISRLIDSEMEYELQANVLDYLADSKDAAKSWANYQLVGNIMRGEVSAVGRDLSDDIAKAIEQEPTVLSSSSIANQLTGSVPANDVWRPVAMFAVAASLALVAVLAINPLQKQSPDNTVADIQPQVELKNRSTQQIAANSEQQLFAQEFGEMLSVHGEFSSTSGLNGLVAYAKLVSNEPLKQ